MKLLGIHHVTAMCSDPEKNREFYSRLLGLRLVKVTVNYDDPGTYHLYYGDSVGSPGSAMTFFPWPSAFRGRAGTGQVGVTGFSVPPGSSAFWKERLRDAGVDANQGTRFGKTFLAFEDFDGLQLELIEDDDHREPWLGAGIGPNEAIRGFHSVSLWVKESQPTVLALIGAMGLQERGAESGRVRLSWEGVAPGALVDVVERPDLPAGRMGVGSVHHVAWRTRDESEQLDWIEHLQSFGLRPTPVQNRTYFKSIYFREPGGVLYEIATDGPGLAVDEPVESLGERLVLPAWLEDQRAEIVARLPEFALSGGAPLR
ncbi:MAG: ring-cleaving dioxygenase [Fimbriimonadaceae bacterium]|nr:ring-cleaving dioxygenase [Fimbriimonadaceae bacterium]QYK58258.1 MAG: ring-cleaving dioxygenase [Fimbriimonadaceae bacterium]